ncbi:hypothetical protein F4823DRAFT_380249 [Ustulina deusta]|nr:hypothetical protein F4823DRAFT_380249 [Ustulina deusta]
MDFPRVLVLLQALTSESHLCAITYQWSCYVTNLDYKSDYPLYGCRSLRVSSYNESHTVENNASHLKLDTDRPTEQELQVNGYIMNKCGAKRAQSHTISKGCPHSTFPATKQTEQNRLRSR